MSDGRVSPTTAQQLQRAETAKSAAEYHDWLNTVRAGGGEYITVSDYDALSENERVTFERSGVSAVNALREEAYKKQLSKQEQQIIREKRIADRVTPTAPSPETVALKSGETVLKSNYDNLDSESKSKLNELGISGYNTWVNLQRKLSDDFLKGHVNIGDNKYIEISAWNKLTPSQQEEVQKTGGSYISVTEAVPPKDVTPVKSFEPKVKATGAFVTAPIKVPSKEEYLESIGIKTPQGIFEQVAAIPSTLYEALPGIQTKREQAVIDWHKIFRLNPTVGSAETFGYATGFTPMRALEPYYGFKDISGAEWALSGVNAALLTMGAWGPAAGKIFSPVLKEIPIIGTIITGAKTIKSMIVPTIKPRSPLSGVFFESPIEVISKGGLKLKSPVSFYRPVQGYGPIIIETPAKVRMPSGKMFQPKNIISGMSINDAPSSITSIRAIRMQFPLKFGLPEYWEKLAASTFEKNITKQSLMQSLYEMKIGTTKQIVNVPIETVLGIKEVGVETERAMRPMLATTYKGKPFTYWTLGPEWTEITIPKYKNIFVPAIVSGYGSGSTRVSVATMTSAQLEKMMEKDEYITWAYSSKPTRRDVPWSTRAPITSPARVPSTFPLIVPTISPAVNPMISPIISPTKTISPVPNETTHPIIKEIFLPGQEPLIGIHPTISPSIGPSVDPGIETFTGTSTQPTTKFGSAIQIVTGLQTATKTATSTKKAEKILDKIFKSPPKEEPETEKKKKKKGLKEEKAISIGLRGIIPGIYIEMPTFRTEPEEIIRPKPIVKKRRTIARTKKWEISPRIISPRV